jgi:hypothetical protein
LLVIDTPVSCDRDCLFDDVRNVLPVEPSLILCESASNVQ